MIKPPPPQTLLKPIKYHRNSSQENYMCKRTTNTSRVGLTLLPYPRDIHNFLQDVYSQTEMRQESIGQAIVMSNNFHLFPICFDSCLSGVSWQVN